MKVDYRLDDHPVCPALYRRPGEGVPPWACQCRRPDGRRLLRKYRHTSEMGCIPQSDVDAFKAAHGLKNDGHARALLYIETFAPPPGRAT
jgi:hypothetical protein